jgi:hypothetical protein
MGFDQPRTIMPRATPATGGADLGAVHGDRDQGDKPQRFIAPR